MLRRISKWLPWVLAGFFFVFMWSRAATAQTGKDVLVLTHANLIDGLSPNPIQDATVLIRGHQIEVVEATGGRLPARARVIDLKGRWLLPGFVDAHVHLFDVASAQRALQYGSTTVRVMGTAFFMDVAMRELHKAGATDIPNIVAAGYQIRPDIVQAWPTFRLDFPNLRRLASGLHGADDLRTVVRAMASRHVDLIKVLATERSGTPDTDPLKRTFSDEELAAIVDEARKLGLPVAAHAHTDEAARAAVLAGVRSVEHGTNVGDETLRLMKVRGTYLVPTLTAWPDEGSPGNPIVAQRSRAMGPLAYDTARRAWKIGVKIVAGTDGAYGPTGNGRRMPDEIAALVKAGIPPMDAIKAGTSISAECLGVANRVGAIKPGLTADLVVVDRNPLEDINALQEILLVVHDGDIVVNRLYP